MNSRKKLMRKQSKEILRSIRKILKKYSRSVRKSSRRKHLSGHREHSDRRMRSRRYHGLADDFLNSAKKAASSYGSSIISGFSKEAKSLTNQALSVAKGAATAGVSTLATAAKGVVSTAVPGGFLLNKYIDKGKDSINKSIKETSADKYIDSASSALSKKVKKL